MGIPEQDYTTAMESRSESAATNTAVKMLLRFLANGNYYELFFFHGSCDLVLDFSASEQTPQTPSWLDFTSSKILERHDSRGNAPSPAPKTLEGDLEEGKGLTLEKVEERPPKARRFLRSHSTEEAAMWGC